MLLILYFLCLGGAIYWAVQRKKANSSDEQKRFQDKPGNVVLQKKCYGTIEKFFFGDFALLALALGVIGPLVMRAKREPEAAFAFFVFSIIPFLMAVFIWIIVSRRAKRSGQKNVMSAFLFESVMLVFKILMCFTVVLIPFVLSFGKPGWETRTTNNGISVAVRRTGDGEYEDVNGNKYYGI